MSKHKKHKNPNQNNELNNNQDLIEVEEELEETEEDIDDIEESSENDTVVETKLPVVENVIVDNTEEHIEVEEPVVTTETPIVPKQNINFYKVGTDYVNDKCINQITATSDLVNAKTICDSSRDTNRKTFHVFDKDGNAVYTSEFNHPRDNYYRVGTEWKNGNCINQRCSCVSRDEACICANNSTKTYGVVHHVYDPTGKIIFSAKTKLTLFAKKKRGVNYADRDIK